MKILQINSVCGIRSTGRICTDIAAELEKQGHTCRIAYGRESVPEQYQKYAVPVGNRWSVMFDGIKTRLLDNAGFNSTAQTKIFVKWIKEYDPDVIHLHNIHGYYLNIRVLFDYLRTCGKKIFWTFHDCWPFTGHCTHFDFAGCQRWQEGCHDCPLRGHYPASKVIDRSKKNYLQKKQLFTGIPNLTIVTPSHWLANIVKQSFLGAYDVQVIPNGIDTTVFRPVTGNFREQYGLQGKKMVMGAAAIWCARKGLPDFLRLAEMLPAEYQVVLVGLTKAQKENLPKNIVGITRTDSPQKLAEIYSHADVFVNPTYEDNYPTVNLEAQACGTPVITYRTGGSVESVPAEQVVEKGDVEALCRAVMELEKCTIYPADYSAATGFQKYVELYLRK